MTSEHLTGNDNTATQAVSPLALAPKTDTTVPALRPVTTASSSTKHRRWLWIGGGVAVLAVGLIAVFEFWTITPDSVVVEITSLQTVIRVLAVNGRIAAARSVDVRSVVTGQLEGLRVAEGDLVVSGQILARVDAEAQNALLRQAMAGLDAAIVAEQRATEIYDRDVALGGNIARTRLETGARDVDAASKEVARQTAMLDQATVILNSYTTRAPSAGRILTVDAEEGQLAGPNFPLLTLADAGDLIVEADVDEAYASQIALDQPAVLQLAGDTATHKGRVSFVSTRVDETTGGLAVKIAFDDLVTAPIGLTVATNIVVDRRDAALTVPRTAPRADGSDQGVFVVTDGVAHLVRLAVVDWPAARLIVTSGLAVGDTVVVDAANITDGQKVTVVQP